jgi:hypothetical protein
VLRPPGGHSRKIPAFEGRCIPAGFLAIPHRTAASTPRSGAPPGRGTSALSVHGLLGNSPLEAGGGSTERPVERETGVAAKRMRRQTAKDDRERRRRTTGTPSRAQGGRQRAGGADRAAGAGRPEICLFCCDQRSPACVGRARRSLVRRTDRTPPRSLLRLPASPRVSLVSRRNPSGDRPPAAALECNRICETEY